MATRTRLTADCLKTLHDAATSIIEKLAPAVEPAGACYLYTAAGLGLLRGTGVKFQAGAAMPPNTALHAGWGIIVHPATHSYLLSGATEVGEDGTFDGHCWLAYPEGDVVDLQARYAGEAAPFDSVVTYHSIPRLARSVRTHHRDLIEAVKREASKWRIS